MTLVAVVLAQCFVMNDPTPGWKQIALPSNAPQLAAPDGYEQFRVSDPVVVTHDLEEVLASATRSAIGRQRFELALPVNTKTVTLHFARPLDSAKVDAVVEGPRGRMSLLDERRRSGSTLVLQIALSDASRAVVTVHHHLRETPTLEAASVEQQLVPRASADFAPQLKLENSLYVRSPGGPLTLCQRPAQPMTVTSRALHEGAVRSVAAIRAPTR